ncbi:Hypothetical protein FKW44_012280 [Caligus rogercresseyi]|uniref:Uncharacterized protein n=1 Tax=Caligus rogercresseyi TaxID=217165 RepID=A0A7T8HJI3_CALRO|nr:Hypothetical protein FKW44_012280 [Caligus rogercresseyi]
MANILLHKAGLPSLNRISVRAVAMETWKCFASRDGSNGDRNPVGKILFGAQGGVRSTRSRTARLIRSPLPKSVATFVTSAAAIWNSSPKLRNAKTMREAYVVANSLEKCAPI